MKDIKDYEVNITEEFLDVEFPDLDTSAGMGFLSCCNKGEPQ